MLQQMLTGIAFMVSIFINILASRLGYDNIVSGDKDILLPFSSMIFLFYPLLIYLPEAHYKITTFGDAVHSTTQTEEDEEEKFPFAFMITLYCITGAIILHRLFFFNSDSSNPEIKGVITSTQRSTAGNNQAEYRAESLILKEYLSLAIGLENIVSSFYITIEDDPRSVRNQFIIYSIFSLIINFSYGYLNGWSTVPKRMHRKLTNFINLGTILGYLLGLIAEDNLIMLVLPCLCCGLMIYCSTLICLPALFSNGENHTQDKFRYGSIFTALLLTVVYHPICYLLRV